MKYFLDCEFIEDGFAIDLVSIGIVAEDGREYYACNSECNFTKASDWVIENVLRPIGVEPMPSGIENGAMRPIDPLIWKTTEQIRNEIAGFCGCFSVTKLEYAERNFLSIFLEDRLISSLSFELDSNMPSPEFWGEWPSYDWVAFCQLFGTMMDLPKGFPMRCNDIIQEAERRGLTWEDLPPSLETEGNHNALLGAKTVQMRYQWLMETAEIRLKLS